MGSDIDIIECVDELCNDLVLVFEWFSTLLLRFRCPKVPLKEKSPAAELRLRTPVDEGLNAVGVAGEDDDVDKDAKLEVDEVIDVLKALSVFELFFALEFDVLYDK